MRVALSKFLLGSFNYSKGVSINSTFASSVRQDIEPWNTKVVFVSGTFFNDKLLRHEYLDKDDNRVELL